MKIPSFLQSNLPKISISKIKIPHFWQNRKFVFTGVVILCIAIGFGAGAYFKDNYNQAKEYFSKFSFPSPNIFTQEISGRQNAAIPEYAPQTSQEEMVIKAVKNVSPSVVSIIISKNMPIYEQYFVNPFGKSSPFNIQIPQLRQKGTQLQEIGGGTGFIISSDGMILTNKHVVSDNSAEYTVLTNDGKKYSAKVLALDPTQDVAVIQIKDAIAGSFKPAIIGNSDSVQLGQSVIAIGNALGELRNTISVGVISGLGRTITASGGGVVETIDNVIQTDAAINVGNSGGPLLNLKGEVIGINTATASGAQNISFAIPINVAKKDIEQVKSTGKISYPLLGIYYTVITPELKQKYNLSVDYGAWVGRDAEGQKTSKVFITNSPAEKSGIQRDDIVLELNGEKITTNNPLNKIITKYNPGNTITLKILRSEQEKTLQLILGERME